MNVPYVMDEIREYFEEWYSGNLTRSIKFPDQYKYEEVQNEWVAFQAGYHKAYELVVNAMVMYIEQKYKK